MGQILQFKNKFICKDRLSYSGYLSRLHDLDIMRLAVSNMVPNVKVSPQFCDARAVDLMVSVALNGITENTIDLLSLDGVFIWKETPACKVIKKEIELRGGLLECQNLN